MKWMYRFCYPFYVAAMVVASPFVAKVRRGLRGRRGLVERVRAQVGDWNQRPFWFHFASSGEFEQAIPILDALREKRPGTPIFLTYFSPSGKRAVELEADRRRLAARALPWDAADYSPYDFAWTVRRYLDVVRPAALVLMNREFWPELIHQATERKIPVSLFASTFSARVRQWLWFYKPLLEKLSLVATVDDPSARALDLALSAPVEKLGDPRRERVLSRREMALPNPQPKIPRCFVAASLWPEDFEALVPTFEFLLSAMPPWTLWLVPHEPEESFLHEMESWFSQRGLATHRWSKLTDPDHDVHRVVLVDSVGRLAELYSRASLAFVGGSFRAKVHNVLEPAAYGVPVLTGPFIQNSPEALEMQSAGAGLFSAQSPEALAHEVANLLKLSNVESEGEKAFAFLERHRGTAQAYVQRLLQVRGYF